MAISAVINTRNEEHNLRRCLESLTWVDEIIIVDMESGDRTLDISRNYTKFIYKHVFTGYVEPARNFAIDKATKDWIFIVDADEVVSPELAANIHALTSSSESASFYRLPRKNIVFGKWIKHGLWWPDYQIRLFKKGSVVWKEEIHSVPFTYGLGKDLEISENNALIHYHYQSISEYVERLNRYTTQQAQERKSTREKPFSWLSIPTLAFEEFLRRYYLAQGYKDGLHGLVLALLQSFSELVLACKLWEQSRFQEATPEQIQMGLSTFRTDKGREFEYWVNRTQTEKSVVRRLLKRLHP